jgi:hypothetical protein
MVLLVHGFPSKIAALQFEWAWQNPHLSRQAPLESKLVLRKKLEGKTRYQKPSLSMIQRVEILREMLGFEGWRKWPLKVSILSEDVVKVWEKVGKKEGVREISWDIVGQELLAVESVEGDERTAQEKQRDLNLEKLKTLDLHDCAFPDPLTMLIVAEFLTPHLAKSQSIFTPCRSKVSISCDICHKSLPQNHIEIALCPHETCPSATHLKCLASRLEKSNSILPVKGSCPICNKEILWGDVIRGVFGRAGRMDFIPAEQDETPEFESDEEEEVEAPPPRRRRSRPSGLINLTGKPKTQKIITPKRPRGKGKQQNKGDTGEVTVVPASDEESTSKPVRQKQKSRRKTLEDLEVVDVSEGAVSPKAQVPRKKAEKKQVENVIPDSAGEERDVWVISSDDE